VACYQPGGRHEDPSSQVTFAEQLQRGEKNRAPDLDLIPVEMGRGPVGDETGER
jgi:hypothetical protein